MLVGEPLCETYVMLIALLDQKIPRSIDIPRLLAFFDWKRDARVERRSKSELALFVSYANHCLSLSISITALMI
jgi:hypothetical protein